MTGLGIDLGTANTVVAHPRRGILLREPSAIALRATAHRPRVVAFGTPARELVGRAPDDIVCHRPVRDGVVTDLELAGRFLGVVVAAIRPHRWQRWRLRAVVGVPGDATSLERRGLEEVAEAAHIAVPRLVPEAVAALLGCGLDPLDVTTRVVVDVGGGTAEITALSYGGVVTRRSCRTAGDEMTLAVQQYLRTEHQLLVGERTAEEVKIRASTEDEPSLLVAGQDAATGRPRVLTLAVEEVDEALRPVADTVLGTLASVVDDLRPEGVADLARDGVVAVGGGVLARGFAKRLEAALGFPVRLADDPLGCVATGAATCLARPDVLAAFAPA